VPKALTGSRVQEFRFIELYVELVPGGLMVWQLVSQLELARYTNEHKILLGLLEIGSRRAEPTTSRAS
jgi:hypothetical protein